MRYDDGRRDIRLSLRDQFLEAVEAINAAVFSNDKENKSRNGDALEMVPAQNALVYIDPPYYTPLGDNEYVRRYHFIEGLVRDWQGVEIQEHTQTKKFKSYPTPFSTRKGASDAFDYLFKKFRHNLLLVSYSSNSLPSQDEMVSIMSKYKKVEVVPIDYKYSFGNQGNKVGNNNNDVKEYLFIGY
jgi:DNA adenine methylase